LHSRRFLRRRHRPVRRKYNHIVESKHRVKLDDRGILMPQRKAYFKSEQGDIYPFAQVTCIKQNANGGKLADIFYGDPLTSMPIGIHGEEAARFLKEYMIWIEDISL
jgi:hypothetical protein